MNNSENFPISMEEIPLEKIHDFWKIHWDYLNRDLMIDEEDKLYFSGDEYRGILKEHMARISDRHHMVYFLRDGVRIGAAQYTTYQSEDGKCFILDFWVFPEFRGNGTGHRCFETLAQYAQMDGAQYFELNCDRENARRFWRDNGFVYNGQDEYDMALFIKKDTL